MMLGICVTTLTLSVYVFYRDIKISNKKINNQILRARKSQKLNDMRKKAMLV